jgi:hypothetical protein
MANVMPSGDDRDVDVQLIPFPPLRSDNQVRELRPLLIELMMPEISQASQPVSSPRAKIRRFQISESSELSWEMEK